MSRSTLLLPLAMAGLLCGSGAQAALWTGNEGGSPVPAPGAVQLAQYGDVDIFFDRLGRRVILDRYTGEVLAIEPRRQGRREGRRERRNDIWRREPPDSERYYLDDPEDMRRLMERQARGRIIAPPIEEYEIDPGEPDFEELPAPPRRSLPRPFDEPSVVERRPLETEPGRQAAIAEPELPPEVQDTSPGEPPASIEPPTSSRARTEVAALQVLLDRVGASPGVIDGRFGSNVDKALAAYREITGQNLKSTDAEGISKALAGTGGDPFMSYTITASDAAGPYVASVPADYGQKAKLERLSFTSVSEMLAEKFHMDEAYLKALNPEANFNRVGTIIRVANTGAPVARPVARIVADKGRRQVRAYGEDGKLVAAYPATIGSSDTPSPSGVHGVERIAFDPEYTYNPKLNFKQGENDKVLTIPPGPNGPVGSIWIALDKPTYGIHGTPEPSKIGKTESHGCVRLTNWDAAELARIVKKGVPVEFVE